MCYESQGKIHVHTDLTGLHATMRKIRKNFAANTAIFENARSFLKRYLNDVGRSRRLNTWENDKVLYDFTDEEGTIRDLDERKKNLLDGDASTDQEGLHTPERNVDFEVDDNKRRNSIPSLISNLEGRLERNDPVFETFHVLEKEFDRDV